jgi:hypothetical protein
LIILFSVFPNTATELDVCASQALQLGASCN